MFSALKTFHFTLCFALFFNAENINFFTRVTLDPNFEQSREEAETHKEAFHHFYGFFNS